MRWLLFLAVGVGCLSTHETLGFFKHPPRGNRTLSMLLMLGLGWLPLVAWIINTLWPQY